MEVHQDPDNAPSDGANMIDIKDLDSIVKKLKRIHDTNYPEEILPISNYNSNVNRTWAEVQARYDRFDG